MDADFFSLLFNAFLLIGVLAAFKSRGRINELMNKVVHLQKVVDYQTSQIEKLKGQGANEEPKTENAQEKELKDKNALVEEVKQRLESEELELPSTDQPELETSNPWQHKAEEQLSSQKTIKQADLSGSVEFTSFSLEGLLKGSGLFWLGAIILAIGGIFLAKYSIEAGLLPPSVRVILGSIFGVLLIATAEFVNRFK